MMMIEMLEVADAGVGDVSVCLYDAEGRDVAIETVDNGNNTFDVAFVPDSPRPITAKIYFTDREIPGSPYSIQVQPHLAVERITVHQPQTGIYRYREIQTERQTD